MNLVVGQNLTAVGLSGEVEVFDVRAPLKPEVAVGQGLKASNQFARMLGGIDVRAEQFDFSCSGRVRDRLIEKADSLNAKLEAALMGIVTRVDVDNLSMLRLSVNALVAEGAESSALKYACLAENWCRRADFTDSVATGTALALTAEMFARLHRYEEAVKLFKSSSSVLSKVLEYEHPLVACNRVRHRQTLTELAFSNRNKLPAPYGAGYLKAAESQNLCPLVWDGSSL